MESQKDAAPIDVALRHLRLSLAALKRCTSDESSPATAQLSELKEASIDIIKGCFHLERRAILQLEQTVSAQKRQISDYSAQLETQRVSHKRLKQDLSSCKEFTHKLVSEKKDMLNLKRMSEWKVTVLEKQLVKERLASGEQVVLLDKRLSKAKAKLSKEKEEKLCVICFDKPRSTLIMPCFHFQFCFACLMRHKEINGNTCPTCRGTIQGLCMSPFLRT
ncbi:hypothetical protein L7F22_041393 [Adiantum nelumboides]|nr:hypothetical protein [Adiantum nelumboides]